MKKGLKIFIVILLCLVCTSNITYAAEILSDAKNWIDLGNNHKDTTQIDRTKFNEFAGILWEIGIFVVLIGGTILGIKYMFASVEEKASIKETMKPYIIGAVIILGALTIWKILIEFMDNMI